MKYLTVMLALKICVAKIEKNLMVGRTENINGANKEGICKMTEPLTIREEMQNYLDGISSRIAIEDAKKGNKVVLLPEGNELFIDLDSEDSLKLFNKRLKSLGVWHSTADKRVTPSAKKNHYHAIITLKANIDPMQRIFLQLFLGSDPIRELLSLQRILMEDPYPTLFIEKKGEQND